jgi:hypothetical protein
MKYLTKLLTILALLTLLLIPTSSARALGPLDGGPVIFGGNYTLASGETLNGDLVVFGGNVNIEEEAEVKGSIIIFGGNVVLNGTMTGDLVLIGGSGSMGGKAVVEGDLVTVGGTVSRAEGARVEGEVLNDPTIEIPVPTIPDVPAVPDVPNVPDLPVIPSVTEARGWDNPVGSAFGVLGQAVLMASLAMLLSLFLRPQMERVAHTFIQQPLVVGGVGLLTVPAAVIAFFILLLTIIGPIMLAVAFVAAMLFGIISIGMEVGERFTQTAGQNWSPVLTAGFGTFLLVLVAQGIGLVQCVGWLAPFLLGIAAIGAVVMTFLQRKNPPVAAAQVSGPDELLPPAS